MSKFITFVGMLFAKYAPVAGIESVDRVGSMTVDGAEVLGVEVNEDRTVNITVDSEYRNQYTFHRHALAEGKVTIDEATGTGIWYAMPTRANWHGEASIIKFFKDATVDASDYIKRELYAYD